MKPNNFPLRVNLNGAEEIYTQTSGISEKFTLNSAKAFANAIEITYDDLYTACIDGELIAGSHYIITDYRTCYDQPNYDVYGNTITDSSIYHQSEIEPIIVMAISNNALSADAYQPKYPFDKIKYSISFNGTEITDGDAYGRITERIDEWNNRTDYDHRTILFKRYKTYFHDFDSPLSGTINNDSSTPIDGGYSITIVGTDTDFENQLELGNVIYVDDKWYKVTAINSATNMEVSGVESFGFSGEKYYKATPQVDGDASQILYTHTQMLNEDVDNNDEAQLSDFIMDGTVQDGTKWFGEGSLYFTNLYPGLFTMVATNVDIDYFSVDGGLGADGSGQYDVYQYNTTVGGNDYTAYARKVWDAGDPSVNNIIIVNTDGSGLVHDYSSSTDDDYQKVSNLNSNGVTEVHFLVTSKRDGIELTNSEIESVVDTYLGLVDGLTMSARLSVLNSSYENITNNVPDLFLFNDVQDEPSSIDDGGEDMYDTGNYLYTDRSETYRSYEYKNNNIIGDAYREMLTFRSEEELENNNSVTSVNNWIGDHSLFYLQDSLSTSNFMLANNVFGFYSYSNKLGDRCYNNSTYNWFNRNQISGTFQRNRLYRGFYANVIGEYFTENTFYGQTWRNKIGEDFYENIIGRNDFQNNVINNGFNNNFVALYGDFYKNHIGNGFNDNQIWCEFYGNHIGNGFNENVIYYNFFENYIGEKFNNNDLGNNTQIGNYSFFSNRIRTNFYNNTIIDNSFWQNVIDGEFQNNTTNGQFRYNYVKFDVIGIDFSSSTHVYNFYNCDIYLDANGATKLSYIDTTNTPVYGVNVYA